MAIFVVAVGTVLAGCGCWAIYFGYSIVQVERGWSVLIAGAAVLSGGVITTALGFVLQRLTSIHQALLQSAVRPLDARADASLTGTSADPSALLHDVEPAPAATAQLEFPGLGPHDHDAAAEVPLVAPIVAAAIPLERAAVPVEAHAAAADHSAVLPIEDVQPLPPTPEPPTPHPTTRQQIDDMWRVVDEELTKTDWAKALLEADPAPPPEQSTASHKPPHDDARHTLDEPHALDESHASAVADDEHLAADLSEATRFEDFIGDPALLSHPRDQEAAESPPALHHAAELHAAPNVTHDGDLLVSPPPVPDAGSAAATHEPAETRPEEQPASAPAAHMIGRYEADGTTYSMFSDGSIEAQSPEGLYRFASMTELKAFIEQAAP